MRDLQNQGWCVLQLWECEVENKPEEVLERLYNLLRMDES